MDNRNEPQQYTAPTRPATMPVDGSIPLGNFVQSRPVGSGMPIARVARAAPLASPIAGSSPSKCARKDRGPNWVPQEILAFISAKREMYLEELDIIDGRDLMTPETSKWNQVSQEVMRCGFSPCLRDGPACKTKWNQLIPDYKRIADYLSRTGRNALDFWDMSSIERKAEGLPRLFGQDVYGAINEWYGNRPQIQPPHLRDLLSPNDGNYRHIQQDQHHDMEDVQSEPETEDPTDTPQPEAVETTEESSPPRSPRRSRSTPLRPTLQPDAMPSPVFRAFSGLPPGANPQVISSSDTSQYAVHKRPGNTAVRRKSISGHTVIAEATKATGAVMAAQMQEIADASRDLERSKIEVQLKLFTEQMAYQREKDGRTYENVAIANENARLAIMKQGEMVHCLSQLSTVLSTGFSMSSQASQVPMTPGAKQHHATATELRHSVGRTYSASHQNFTVQQNSPGHHIYAAPQGAGGIPSYIAHPNSSLQGIPAYQATEYGHTEVPEGPTQEAGGSKEQAARLAAACTEVAPPYLLPSTTVESTRSETPTDAAPPP